MSDEAIANVMSKQTADPSKRVAQHLLAREVLELVHGLSAAEKTEAEHQAMRTPTLRVIADTATTDYNRIELPKALVVDLPVTTVLHNAGLASSNSAARRMIAGGGVYIAGKPANGKGEELDFVQVGNGEAVQTPQLIDGTLVFRLGKWKVRVVKVVEEFERGREEAISDVIESFR